MDRRISAGLAAALDPSWDVSSSAPPPRALEIAEAFLARRCLEVLGGFKESLANDLECLSLTPREDVNDAGFSASR